MERQLTESAHRLELLSWAAIRPDILACLWPVFEFRLSRGVWSAVAPQQEGLRGSDPPSRGVCEAAAPLNKAGGLEGGSPPGEGDKNKQTNMYMNTYMYTAVYLYMICIYVYIHIHMCFASWPEAWYDSGLCRRMF